MLYILLCPSFLPFSLPPSLYSLLPPFSLSPSLLSLLPLSLPPPSTRSFLPSPSLPPSSLYSLLPPSTPSSLYSFLPLLTPSSLLPLLPSTCSFLPSCQDAEKHGLYCHEVIELNEDISLLLILPPSDQVCNPLLPPPSPLHHNNYLLPFAPLPSFIHLSISLSPTFSTPFPTPSFPLPPSPSLTPSISLIRSVLRQAVLIILPNFRTLWLCQSILLR